MLRNVLWMLGVVLGLGWLGAALQGCGNESVATPRETGAAISPWTGCYQGTFTGTDRGRWDGEVSSSGGLRIVIHLGAVNFTLTGLVKNDGRFTASNPSQGSSSGRFKIANGKRVCTGSWKGAVHGQGTLSGSKVACGPATVIGSVYRASGSKFVPLGGVKVSIGARSATSASRTGKFTLNNVPPGSFTIKVKAPNSLQVLNPKALKGTAASGRTVDVGRILLGSSPPGGP